MTKRREFLQTTAALAGSLILPNAVLASPAHNFHFIHTDTLNHWSVLDPVQWSLEHAHETIMANTDAEVWPTSEMVWGKRLKLEARS